MARTMGVEQAYTMVQALYEQATGEASIAVVDTATFTSVAQSVMQLGYNQVLTALAEVISTIKIAERPYSAKFKLVWKNAESFGNHILKISFFDNADAEQNPAWGLQDGQTLGVHNVKLPKAYEANIYGQDTVDAYITLPRKQLRTAFQSPEQMAQFFSGLMTSIENQLEGQKEALSRSVVCNFVGGKIGYNASSGATGVHIVNLITDFNTDYGTSYADMAAIRASGDYEKFIEYAFYRMNSIARKMTNRSANYHVNPVNDTDNPGIIKRHTPRDRLRFMVLADYMEEISATVRTNIYNNEYLREVANETVDFWQSEDNVDTIKVTASYMDDDGTVKTYSCNQSNVFGVMFDEDALGVGVTDEFRGETPLDPEKEAKNVYFKLDVRTYNDFTENGVVLLLE